LIFFVLFLYDVSIRIIFIRPDLEVDPAKKPGPGLHGLTRVNPEKLKRLMQNLYRASLQIIPICIHAIHRQELIEGKLFKRWKCQLHVACLFSNSLPTHAQTYKNMVTNEYVDSDYSINFFWQELSKLLETKKLVINHQNFAAWRKKEKKKIRNTKAINNLYSSQKIVYTIIIIIIIIIFFQKKNNKLCTTRIYE
jgi:hypothetical protein